MVPFKSFFFEGATPKDGSNCEMVLSITGLESQMYGSKDVTPATIPTDIIGFLELGPISFAGIQVTGLPDPLASFLARVPLEDSTSVSEHQVKLLVVFFSFSHDWVLCRWEHADVYQRRLQHCARCHVRQRHH